MAGGGKGSSHPEDQLLVTKPQPRIRRFAPLRFVRAGSHGKKSTYAELNLTSMVDMLTILVVFLLQTFSASGELLTVQKNIALPEAQNFKDLEQAPIIAVSKDSVTLDGRMVANAEQLNAENTADWKIPDLHDQLVTLKNNYKLLHPSENFAGMVIVQADKSVDFKVIKKVMYSCAVAGYQNVNFAVQQKSKGGT
jgi:biopolymer transport protein ExbD